jgi:hypothetical protein
MKPSSPLLFLRTYFTSVTSSRYCVQSEENGIEMSYCIVFLYCSISIIIGEQIVNTFYIPNSD